MKRIIIATFAAAIVTAAGADYKYLQWSDNTAEEKWGFQENVYAFAEYDMPDGYNLVQQINYYIADGTGYNITAVIFDYTRQRVYLKTIRPTTEGWYSVYPYWPNTRNVFYVGLWWTTADNPKLGVDTDSPHHRDMMWIYQYNWIHPENMHDFMIGAGVTNTAAAASTSLGRVKAVFK